MPGVGCPRWGGAQFDTLFVAQVGGLGVGSDVDAAQFIGLVDAQAHRDVEDLCDDPSDDEGIGKHSQGCQRLDAKQAKAAAVEQSVDLLWGGLCGEQAEPELQFDGQGADVAGGDGGVDKDHGGVLPCGERVRSGTQHGHEYRVLGTLKGRTDALEPTLVTLTDASDVFPLFQHPGTEFIYMLSGKMIYGHGAYEYAMAE